jgi:hypothetical protein
MTILATKDRIVSDVLKYDLFPEFGFCREMRTVTLEAGMKVGAVVTAAGAWVAAAAVANADAVVIDPRLDVADALGAGAVSVLCLVRGPAGVGRDCLQFKGSVTSSNIDSAAAALLAKSIKVEKQV